ncbi:MAG: N-acetylmuramoyl-L-alanine amidase [Candidatus Kapabacteria bacterium]|nr:N-acetylmuramoyl-L-alanine amidase [Candidatus Kapabacteria bacterium]
MKIVNSKLDGESIINVEQKPSPNHGSSFKANFPDTIIIHYTAGRNAKESVSTLCNPAHQASAHVVIGRDNSITQLVNFNTVAWHAGQSSYGGRDGFNQYSIGIEIDNCGYLIKQGDDFLSWFGGAYRLSDAFEGKHRNPQVKYEYWLRYTRWQIQTVEEICRLLIAEYGIKCILGHEEIAPSRKIDPGPAFPLDKLRDKLFNSDRSSDAPAEQFPKSGVVTASSLNIRVDAIINASRVATPLPNGTVLTILSEKDGWYSVDAGVKGWVKKEFVDG